MLKSYEVNRVKESFEMIPEKEPVFVIRAADVAAGDVVRKWADVNESRGGDPRLSTAARKHAKLMDQWSVQMKKDIYD